MIFSHSFIPELIQFVFNVASIALNVVFINMLRREFFHLNMRIILALNSISLIVAQLSALISDNLLEHAPFEWSGLQSVADVMREAGLNVNTFMIVPLVGERMVASLCSHKYEFAGRPIYMVFALGFVAFSWIFNIWAGIYTKAMLSTFDLNGEYVKLYEDNEYKKNLMIIYFAAGGMINALSFLVFLILYKYNQYRYEDGINYSRHTLSARYQLAENARTGKQLMPVALLTTVTQVYYGYMLTGAIWSYFTSSFTRLLFLITPPISALVAFLTPLLYIMGHDALRKNVHTVLVKARPDSAAAAAAAPNTNVEGLNGKNLIMDHDVSAEMHFKMLTKSWL